MKLLYIVANSKPEELSSCQRVGRKVVETFLRENPSYKVEEIRLFDTYLPAPNHHYFMSRAELVSGEKLAQLTEQQKQDVHRMKELCQLFQSADRYVIAAPMWTLSFPYKLKQFLDCIILNKETISISEKGVKGLLTNKTRKMVYVQSSASMFPFSLIKAPFIGARMNHGVTYIKDVFRFIGIRHVQSIFVEGTEIDIGVESAIAKAIKKVPRVVKKLK